jgi:hypothetical protein
MSNATVHELRETDDVWTVSDVFGEKVLQIDRADGLQRAITEQSPEKRPEQG